MSNYVFQIKKKEQKKNNVMSTYEKKTKESKKKVKKLIFFVREREVSVPIFKKLINFTTIY